MTASADVLARNWWAVLLRGIAGVLFGILTLAAPGVSLAVLVLAYGAYAFVDGVFALVAATRGHAPDGRWGWLVLQGVAGVLAGVVTLLWPGITAFALLYIIAAWALITGALEVGVAVRLRKVLAHEWLLVLSGVASVALGLLLMTFPGSGLLVLVLWIGAYAFLSGVLLVGLALRLRSWGSSHLHQLHSPSTA